MGFFRDVDGLLKRINQALNAMNVGLVEVGDHVIRVLVDLLEAVGRILREAFRVVYHFLRDFFRNLLRIIWHATELLLIPCFFLFVASFGDEMRTVGYHRWVGVLLEVLGYLSLALVSLAFVASFARRSESGDELTETPRRGRGTFPLLNLLAVVSVLGFSMNPGHHFSSGFLRGVQVVAARSVRFALPDDAQATPIAKLRRDLDDILGPPPLRGGNVDVADPPIVRQLEVGVPPEGMSPEFLGRVTTEILIGVDGRVRAVLTPPSTPVARAFAQSLRNWEFAPTVVRGRERALRTTVSFDWAGVELPVAEAARVTGSGRIVGGTKLVAEITNESSWTIGGVGHTLRSAAGVRAEAWERACLTLVVIPPGGKGEVECEFEAISSPLDGWRWTVAALGVTPGQ